MKFLQWFACWWNNPPINCSWVMRKIPHYVRGELDLFSVEIVAHLVNCPRCQQEERIERELRTLTLGINQETIMRS